MSRTRSSRSTTAAGTPPLSSCSARAGCGRSCGWFACAATRDTRRRSPPGLHRSFGQYVVSIDADLQDPPEKIGEMLRLAQRDRPGRGLRGTRRPHLRQLLQAAHRRGVLLAHAARGRHLGAPPGRRLPAAQPRGGGDTQGAARARAGLPAAGALAGLSQRRDHLWPGERVAGSTKYPLARMLRLAFNSVTGFSAAPLRLATWLGLAAFFFCLLMMVLGLVATAGGVTVPGWTSLFVAVLLLGGVPAHLPGPARGVHRADLHGGAEPADVPDRLRLRRGRPGRGGRRRAALETPAAQPVGPVTGSSRNTRRTTRSAAWPSSQAQNRARKSARAAAAVPA